MTKFLSELLHHYNVVRKRVRKKAQDGPAGAQSTAAPAAATKLLANQSGTI